MKTTHKVTKIVSGMVILVLCLASVQTAFAQALTPFDAQHSIIRVPGDAATIQSALTKYSDGDIIELAAGTYYAPTGGWMLGPNKAKGFTMRAAPGAQVTLSGGNTTEIFRLQNSTRAQGRPFVFKGITFEGGRTSVEGLAGGMTIMEGEAEFIDCVFQNNQANVHTSVGGAMLISDHSIVYFSNTIFRNNSSTMGGGAIGIRSQAIVYIINGQFQNNSTNVPGHVVGASGGGINTGNSVLRIANTRFEGNQAASFGGALYGIGNWVQPFSTPQNDMLVVNSTFVNNQVDYVTNQGFPAEGGAVNVEDSTILKIYNSRFEKNSANIGAGVNLYRANAEIYNSVFRGNAAIGTNFTSTFGGAIAANSQDTSVDGGSNWPTVRLLVEDSYFQGRYDTVGATALNGGCLQVGGDGNRISGTGGVAAMGTVAENRAVVVLRRDIFNDCDAQAGAPFSGAGGGVVVNITDLTVEDVMILKSDALGTGGAGGGMAILNRSVANINRSSFGLNTATDPSHTSVNQFGGGMFVQASTVNVTNSHFVGNEVSVNISEPEFQSFGAAIFSGPDESLGLGSNGSVSNSTFSHNIGVSIFDDDRQNGSINGMTYNGNQFFGNTFGGHIYRDSLVSPWNSDQLNAGVINRSNGTSTDKSTINNQALGTSPTYGVLQYAPAKVLPATASGDPAQVMPVYLGYVWDGNNGQLNGAGLPEKGGTLSTSSALDAALVVDGGQYFASVQMAAQPGGSFNAIPQTQDTINAVWDTQGSFLTAAVNRSVQINPAASGSVQISNVTNDVDYRMYLITAEGGKVIPMQIVPVLNAPVEDTVVAGKNLSLNRGVFVISNDGGGILTWTATGGIPGLTTLETTSGQTTTTATVSFLVNPSGFASGTYDTSFTIEGGSAGTQVINVTIVVLDTVHRVFMPSLRH